MDTLIGLANEGYVDIALVGSETIYRIYRNDLSVDDLMKHIKYVRDRIPPNTPLGTADIPAAFLENPELIAVCDVVCVNIYPFHSGIRADVAVQNLSDTYQRVADAAIGKKIIISETGWPSEGTPKGDAIPSETNS